MSDMLEPQPPTIPQEVYALWDRVLGRRFRELDPQTQQAVIAAVGGDDGFFCPLALAYDVAVWGQWDEDEETVMKPYGVTFADYEAFLHLHDADGERLYGPEYHAALLAWLQAQQTLAAQLRRMNPDMDAASFQVWLESAWHEYQQEQSDGHTPTSPAV